MRGVAGGWGLQGVLPLRWTGPLVYFPYNDVGSSVSLDITHAFPIASALALRARGAAAT